MTELFTTQPMGVASILMALALLLNVIARGTAPILAAIAQVIRDVGAACIHAIDAWTKRTNDERDCAPKLRDALGRIEALRAELAGLRDELGLGPAPISDPVHVVEEHVREPSGEQRLPAGIPPLPNRRKR